MSHSVQMPALGESVTEGTVTRWLKKEGDQVVEDEPLLEVSTDKVDTEVPAPYSGVLEKILVGEDETVAVGAPLAIIGDGAAAGEPVAAPSSAVDVFMTPPQSVPAAGDVRGAEAAAAPGVEAPVAAVSSAAAPAPVAAVPVVAAAPAVAAAPQAASGTEVTMPAMGESVTEGTITRWLKQVGDEIAEDEPIVEIATDKVDAEVPSPVAGTLLQILAEEDATVEVGMPIAVVGAMQDAPAPIADVAAAPAPEVAPTPTAVVTPEPPAVPEPPAAVAEAPSRSGGYITPVVRKLAADHGVDLAAVVGTGVGGRIRREDVLAAADRIRSTAAPEPTPIPAVIPAAPAVVPAAPVPAPAVVPAAPVPVVAAVPPAEVFAAPATPPALAGTTQPAPRIRQAMARSMMHAATTAAQTTTIIEVDASRVVALRERVGGSFRAREGMELTALPFFVKAAVEAAKANPIINASLSDDLTEITYHPAVHLGVTVDTERGQIVPVIHRADDLNVTGLARRISDLADRTRGGGLTPDEVSGATLTVSSAGASGTMIDTPIVVPPQAAVLALGAIVKRPVVVNDSEGNDVIAVRSIATLALSYDQRFVDGADAARYLAAVKRRVEEGDFQADLGI